MYRSANSHSKVDFIQPASIFHEIKNFQSAVDAGDLFGCYQVIIILILGCC